MRISDWSSDVCSSDLAERERVFRIAVIPLRHEQIDADVEPRQHRFARDAERREDEAADHEDERRELEQEYQRIGGLGALLARLGRGGGRGGGLGVGHDSGFAARATGRQAGRFGWQGADGGDRGSATPTRTPEGTPMAKPDWSSNRSEEH